MAKKDTTNYQQGDEGDVRFWLPPEHNGKPQVLTKARKKRGDVVAYEGENGGREYRSVVEPLDLYISRRYISGEQYEAGDRLFRLWKGSLLEARYATMKYGDTPGGGFDPECVALMPRDYFRAIEAVRGFHPKRIVRRVCLWKDHAGQGQGMSWLLLGLNDLVKHFEAGVKK